MLQIQGLFFFFCAAIGGWAAFSQNIFGVSFNDDALAGVTV